jgi:galactitol-specific phosphotransferase system IIB component
MKADLFAAFAKEASAGNLPGLWRLSPLVHAQALQRAQDLIDKMSPDMLLARVVDGDPLYESTTARGTVHVKRAGKPFADFELESEDQWAEALATNNPTGMLDEAPAGALRILCICTMGFATGVKLRSRAEKILAGWGVEAWLESRGVVEAVERSGLADVLLVTRDEEEVVRSLCAVPQRVIAVENSLDPAEIRRALAKDPAVIAQRLGTT